MIRPTLDKRWWPVLVLLPILALVAALVGRSQRARASSLSPAEDGLRLARALLESAGTSVELVDLPLRDLGSAAASGTAIDRARSRDPGVLVLAFPWQSRDLESIDEPLIRHLVEGGALVFAYSGRESPTEEALYPVLGLGSAVEGPAVAPAELRPASPLAPFEWWAYHDTTWTLEPEQAPGPAPAVPSLPTLELPAWRWAPPAPGGAATGVQVLYRTPEGIPVAFSYRHRAGRVVVLPAAMLHNAHLARGEHARSIPWLRHHLESENRPAADQAADQAAGRDSDRDPARSERTWRFDEYHHGLVRADLARAGAGARGWDRLLLHLLLIYLLALFALGRRFGPAWRSPAPSQGSTAAFLLDLGGHHHQLGHHPAAARLLSERLGEWDPRRRSEEGSGELPRPEQVRTGDQLLDFCHRLERPSTVAVTGFRAPSDPAAFSQETPP